jgi:WD40 repeat protein
LTSDVAKVHSDDITSLDYNPLTKRVYSISKDKMLRIWDFPSKDWLPKAMVGSTKLPAALPSVSDPSRNTSPTRELIAAKLGGDSFNPQGVGV